METGIARPGTCPAGIFPLRFGRVIVAPAAVRQSLIGPVLLPFHQFRDNPVGTANARGKELCVLLPEFLSARIKEVSLVPQGLVLPDPETLGDGDLHRLGILEGLVPHQVSCGWTPDEAEAVLRSTHWSPAKRPSRNTSGGAHPGGLVLEFKGDVTGCDGVAELVDAGRKWPTCLQGLEQFSGHESAVLGSFQAGVEGSLAGVEAGKQLATEETGSSTEKVCCRLSGLGLVVDAETVDHHHIGPRDVPAKLLG